MMITKRNGYFGYFAVFVERDEETNNNYHSWNHTKKQQQ